MNEDSWRSIVMSNLLGKVVVVVDVQADFTELHEGTLAVPGTNQSYLDSVMATTRWFSDKGCPVICTQDYHPLDHVSFYSNHPGHKAFDKVWLGGIEQTLWPPHCVRGTDGARILLPDELITEIVTKGTDNQFDSYSGFRDDGGHETGLQAVLDRFGAGELIIYGLAMDYCVRYTVLDALNRGYGVRLLSDLCRGVNAGGSEQAIVEMQRGGVIIERSHDLRELAAIID